MTDESNPEGLPRLHLDQKAVDDFIKWNEKIVHKRLLARYRRIYGKEFVQEPKEATEEVDK